MGISEHTTAVIAVVLLVILSVAVLIPVIGAANVTTETNANTGDYWDSGAVTMEYADNTLTVDGSTVTFTSASILAVSQQFELTAAGLKYFHDGIVDKIPAGSAVTAWTFTLDESGAFEFSTSNDESVSGTASVAHTYHRVAENGEYVRYNSGNSSLPQPAGTQYFNKQANVVLYRVGGYTVDAWYFGDGAVDDQMRVAYMTATSSSGVATAYLYLLPVEGQDNLYTFGGGSNSESSTTNLFNMLIPAEYLTETEATGTVYTVLSIIPILVIIGIVLVAVGAFIRRE